MTLPLDDVGSGRAIVLLHAGVADRSMWREHLQPLAEEGFRVLALDLPGFGEAPCASVEDAPWTDVIATLDAVGLARAVIVGNSFGGAVALRVAVVTPEIVEGLVLVSAPAPGLEPSHELQAAWAAEESALERGDIDGAVQAVLDAWLLSDAPTELRERVASMQRRTLERQLAHDGAPEGRDPLDDKLEPLAAIDAPALVAVGEHDMGDFHLGADALIRTLPKARREVIANAGHLAPLEQPQAFRELVLAFLRAD